MRSTPIILDRLRHIKYDLQAVWDMDYQMEGDFVNILNKEITFDLVQFLLWSGLISEDPHLTMEGTGKLLRGAITDKKGSLQDITTVCINELMASGWIPRMNDPLDPVFNTGSAGVNETVQEEPIEDQPLSNYILSLVGMAETAGLLDSAKIWKHTPAELADLMKAVSEKERTRELAKDYRMGMICATLMKANGMVWTDTQKPPIWLDFVPHEEKPQTAQEMGNIIRQVNAGVGGVVK